MGSSHDTDTDDCVLCPNPALSGFNNHGSADGRCRGSSHHCSSPPEMPAPVSAACADCAVACDRCPGTRHAEDIPGLVRRDSTFHAISKQCSSIAEGGIKPRNSKALRRASSCRSGFRPRCSWRSWPCLCRAQPPGQRMPFASYAEH